MTLPFLITLDRDNCMGSGMCSFHAPTTFDIDDDMKVVLLDTRDDVAAIRAAAESCPKYVITLTERTTEIEL
ncbi:MAG: ferredoxin [Actinobacteria bacterium]|uniref:Unannotated protein n=1 Tax=freshwater metagenome TaxID=449393 RepID=A0A6J6HBN0_9ZZZZ|nr:ferredoxin [Actinomycetota bacterium]MSX33301.1 ferredoxin [Actinomycetota bacterium]MSX96176.1 ferredoxin [Actinomycetota bacterium]MSY24267.1 ferredoxin [Actinomycetota bacterium]MSZ51120.1 ferredoxin [Actinomycetota bacterium]